MQHQDLKLQIDHLLQQYRYPAQLPEKISFGTQQAVHFIRPETIVYCESDSNYTALYFQDNTKLVVSKTLKEVEEMMVPYGFLRIHHSFIINLKQVSRLIKTEGGRRCGFRGNWRYLLKKDDRLLNWRKSVAVNKQISPDYLKCP